jgi:hypothetical protein
VQLCNPIDSVLIAFANYNKRKGADDAPYSALHQWPDVVYLQYLMSSIQILPPLTKYILHMHTIHEATCFTVERIANVHSDGECSIWPGITFDISSGENNASSAILGTMHGTGAAWMLIQRKTEFSRKKIVRITVVWAECEGTEYSWPSLLFCIG